VFEEKYQELPSNAEILLVCYSGHRSDPAAQLLDSHGYQNVYDMTAGMSAWEWDTESCGPGVNCSTWTGVIETFGTYLNGQTTWSEVIACYQEYVV
jgi:hypothetical protein